MGPATVEDLNNPRFLAYLREHFPGEIEPDATDYPPTPARTQAEAARRYRLAQANRMIRLYREWEASLN